MKKTQKTEEQSEPTKPPEWIAVDWDKVFDVNSAVAMRNMLMLLEATGMRFLKTNPHFDKIKHMLK